MENLAIKQRENLHQEVADHQHNMWLQNPATIAMLENFEIIRQNTLRGAESLAVVRQNEIACQKLIIADTINKLINSIRTNVYNTTKY